MEGLPPKIDVKGQGSQSDAQGMVFYCVRNVGAAKALLERALGSNGNLKKEAAI